MLNKIIIGGLMLLVLLLISFIICSRIELASLEKRFNTYQRAVSLRANYLIRKDSENQETLKQVRGELARRIESVQQLEKYRTESEKLKQERDNFYREIGKELSELAGSIDRTVELEQRKSKLLLDFID